MKLNQELKGISFLEEEIPALRHDQEGKLLGGFSAVNAKADTEEGLKIICPTKTNCSCNKTYCDCPHKPTTPGKEDDTTTKSAAGDMFASSLGLSMLF